MEGNRESRQWPTQAAAAAGGAKVERKVMEKNRRNQMKLLYSKLKSLLPDQHSNNVALNVSDQIEEAINYIKSLEAKVKRQQEKKEWLLLRNRRSSPGDGRNLQLPELKIREMGSAVEVVLTSGFEDRFIFYQIIHIFHEERAQIINASYSVLGTTAFYTLHVEIEDVVYEFGARKLTERLKQLVYDPRLTQKLRSRQQQLPTSTRPGCRPIILRPLPIPILGATRSEATQHKFLMFSLEIERPRVST